jgi:trans-aconitate methyltransferase
MLDLMPSKDTLIIDLGCGDGRISEPFYNEGYSVMGIDSSLEKITTAQKIMPKADLIVGDMRTTEIPHGFIVARNSLQFLKSKREVYNLIKKNLDKSMYFTLFGPKDEKKNSALTWTRKEIDKLVKEIGSVVRFSETIGASKNLLNKPRQSHIFEILRIVK